MTEANDNLGELSLVDEAVIEYLNEGNPSVALLVSGNWGSGKTYHIATRGDRLAARCNKRLISLSVAGLTSREELSQALFFAAAPLFANGNIAALGVFARAGMRWLKVEPDDLKLSAELREGEVAVVIDDIERFAGDQRSVLGFVVDLIDRHRVHVILIAAEEKLLASDKDEAHFGLWKEKIVGRTAQIRPDSRTIVETVLDGMADTVTATKLRPHSELLSDLISAWEMENIRSAKFAIRELCRVVRALGSGFDELAGRKSVLISGLLVGLLELRRDASKRLQIGKFFNHADLSLVTMLSDREKKSGALNPEQLFFEQVGTRYEDSPLILFPGGPVFQQFFVTGEIDAQKMLGAFTHVPAEPTKRELLVTEYYKLSDSEFEAELNSLIDDLKEKRIRSPGEIVAAQAALQHFATNQVTSMSTGDALKLCLDAASSLKDEELGDLDRNVGESFFADSSNPDRAVLLQAIQEKFVEARKRDLNSQQANFFKTLGEDPLDLARRLQPWKVSPLFVGDVTSIAQALERLSPAMLQEFIRFVRGRTRVSNIGEFLGPEKTTLEDLASELSRPRAGALLSSAQLQRLAREIKELSARLE